MNDTLTKDGIVAFLSSLAAEMRVAGPVRDGKVIEYREAPPESFLFGDEISYKSPKEFYFPQTEKLISFRGEEAILAGDPAPMAVFAARVCDLQALRVMREVFLSGRYKDPFFERHMEKNLIIGMACVSKKPGCFCDLLGIDMKFSAFCDVMLEPAGCGNFKVTGLSEKGSSAFLKHSPAERMECDNSRNAETSKPALSLRKEASEARFFELIDWEDALSACQGCGMCTYICPTCHCFEFKDVSERGATNRYRCWDSCMYPRFTLHASGHNPRATNAERYRQRVLHKYLYVMQNIGMAACTGCGRCVRSCPVGINIKTVVEALMEAGA
ncbi:MAG: 4Fe-4S dicluster domain-containing protein [Synergistaceae bacterium]|nr:4Fe-4S dicluster domain-containing protein [Synergistaceae bacterium]